MPVSLEDARAWLRLGAGDEDALVERLIGAVTNICEAFTGQWLIVRAGEEVLALRDRTARLAARPVVGIDAVAAIDAGGGETALSEADYRVDIAGGAARVTVPGAADGARVRVAYRAGMADTASEVPAAIRHGMLRMVQHLYAARDDAALAPPAAIAALWQPWRRLSLGGER
ncbi:hypothetical protein ATE67_12950 [Sphingopyxis sp. H050]|jgi:uncharacterized phiE125 gp8 family phage protein|uniref:head-tail connector protein n=1 Tax=Sphingopyxis sp. H050 TaxID=1759072 RepID=UPI0007378A39|nr:hypothetical protein [Sphingopyxis sp. H050]KTE19565.1 hypothetical protein ATE67_12950 [Sphingopyxis sp. H050]